MDLDLITWDAIWNYTVDQMQNNEFFAAAGFASVLGILWQYTKTYPKKLWTRVERKLVYTVSVYENTALFDYINVWLYHNHNKSYRNVEATTDYSDNNLKFKQFEDLIYLRLGFQYLRVWKGREKLENANNLNNAYLNHFKLSGFFIKRKLNKLLKEIVDFNVALHEREEEFVPTVSFNDGSSWYQSSKVHPKDIDHILMEGKDELINDLDTFLADESWYDKRGILHKRGYLFYGAAGNGKSSLIMSLGKKYRRNVFILNPTRLTDADFLYLYKNIPPNSIFVIEDIDSFFNTKREKEDDSIKFSFSTILNCMDGAFSKKGTISIFTTNHPERLDKALVRTGRMDYHFEIKNPDAQRVNEYLNLFYDGTVEAISFKSANIRVPMAKVQDVCLSNKHTPEIAVKEIKKLLKC